MREGAEPFQPSRCRESREPDVFSPLRTRSSQIWLTYRGAERADAGVWARRLYRRSVFAGMPPDSMVTDALPPPVWRM